MLITLIFGISTTYKLYYLEDLKLAKNYAVNPSGKTPTPMLVPAQALGQPKAVDSVQIEMPCPQCGKKHEVNGYMDLTSQEIKELNLKTNPNVQDNDILICDNCNFALDLKPIKSQVETQSKQKVTFR